MVLLVVLAIKLALGLFYLTQQPLWQYHEADFLRVARILRDAGRLPIPEDYPDGDMATRNANQPPLYYGLIYLVVATLDDNQTAPPGFLPPANCEGYNTNLTDIITTRANNPPLSGTVLAAYMLRGLSLLLGLAAVGFTYLAGRTLFENQPGIALGAAALVAFEPTLVELASEINNDNLILMFGAMHLWLCARFIRAEGGRLGTGIALLIVSVLAVLSKLTGWLLLAMTLMLIAGLVGLRAWRGLSRRQIMIAAAAAGLIGLALIGFAFFNLQQYGSILGRYQGLEATIGRALGGLSPGLALEAAERSPAAGSLRDRLPAGAAGRAAGRRSHDALVSAAGRPAGCGDAGAAVHPVRAGGRISDLPQHPQQRRSDLHQPDDPAGSRALLRAWSARAGADLHRWVQRVDSAEAARLESRSGGVGRGLSAGGGAVDRHLGADECLGESGCADPRSLRRAERYSVR
jgi:hypothetical protein